MPQIQSLAISKPVSNPSLRKLCIIFYLVNDTEEILQIHENHCPVPYYTVFIIWVSVLPSFTVG